MSKEARIKLNNTIRDFSVFLEKEFSSQFKNLTAKEDRHLFFLARILTQMKQVSRELEEEKVIAFPKIIHRDPVKK
jgi:rubrerythrin